MLEEFLRKEAARGGQGASSGAFRTPDPTPGDLSASSIFEDDMRMQHAQQMTEVEKKEGEMGSVQPEVGKRRDPENMRAVLDPNPRARLRWEQKKVIQMVRKGGRLSQRQLIKRTEREHLVKSHNFKTSVKKLGMLARQISGKSIDDAIAQMRFSKKRVAQEVMKQLEYARDEAIVMRGMGLGNKLASQNKMDSNDSSADTSKGTASTITADAPVQIQLKDGKRHTVIDRSKIYIDQAWVGRGPYGKLPEFRARGRVNLLRTPWTHLTVVLKEEATRIREYMQREEKRRRQTLGENVWMQLPDRPVQWQRQWYTF